MSRQPAMMLEKIFAPLKEKPAICDSGSRCSVFLCTLDAADDREGGSSVRW